jgi:hypothetical protein
MVLVVSTALLTMLLVGWIAVSAIACLGLRGLNLRYAVASADRKSTRLNSSHI